MHLLLLLVSLSGSHYDQHALPQHLLDTHAGGMYLSLESRNKPYKMEQKKQRVIRSGSVEDPDHLFAKAVPGSDRKESESDSKEASSEKLLKKNSKSAGINYFVV